jgi:hypothetical protein
MLPVNDAGIFASQRTYYNSEQQKVAATIMAHPFSI